MKPQPTNVVGQPLVLGDKKPLEIFFSQYPEFRYWPGKSSVSEFHRLCRQYGWEKDGPEKEVARYEFNIAMKKEFDSLYGSDEKDISNWHKLCYILSIDPVPETLRECRAVSSKLCIPIDFSFKSILVSPRLSVQSTSISSTSSKDPERTFVSSNLRKSSASILDRRGNSSRRKMLWMAGY